MRITLKFCLQANIHNEIQAKTMTIMFLEAAKLTDACEITDQKLIICQLAVGKKRNSVYIKIKEERKEGKRNKERKRKIENKKTKMCITSF